MNIEERRLQVQQQHQARAERKAQAETELAELTELAAEVLQYESISMMVDKVQTPAQRRAHEPIGQSKRWSASCTIAGMTPSEFITKFDLAEYMYDGFDASQWKYTQKAALAEQAKACTEEFIMIMSRLRQDCRPETFTEITTTLKAGK